MGRLIPAGTGLEHYRNVRLLTVPPEMPAPSEEEEAAAQLTPEEAAALDFLRSSRPGSQHEKPPSDESEAVEE